MERFQFLILSIIRKNFKRRNLKIIRPLTNWPSKSSSKSTSLPKSNSKPTRWFTAMTWKVMRKSRKLYQMKRVMKPQVLEFGSLKPRQKTICRKDKPKVRYNGWVSSSWVIPSLLTCFPSRPKLMNNTTSTCSMSKSMTNYKSWLIC